MHGVTESVSFIANNSYMVFDIGPTIVHDLKVKTKKKWCIDKFPIQIARYKQSWKNKQPTFIFEINRLE